jgi:hypothetical protein
MRAANRRRQSTEQELRQRSPDPHLAEHRRLLDGDHGARERLAVALLREVTPVVSRIVWPADSGPVGQAMDDALMDYLNAPAKFDPTRGSLVNYVVTAAVRNVLNLQQAELRRTRAEGCAAAWFQIQRAQSRLAASMSDIVTEMILTCCDAKEQAFAWAWRERAGIDELAALAGLPDDAADATKKEVVRRVSERLRLRFKRYLQRSPAGRRRS